MQSYARIKARCYMMNSSRADLTIDNGRFGETIKKSAKKILVVTCRNWDASHTHDQDYITQIVGMLFVYCWCTWWENTSNILSLYPPNIQSIYFRYSTAYHQFPTIYSSTNQEDTQQHSNFFPQMHTIYLSRYLFVCLSMRNLPVPSHTLAGHG